MEKSKVVLNDVPLTPTEIVQLTSKVNLFTRSAFVLAVIIPLIVSIVWHTGNTVLPKWDAADYLQTSYNIYDSFHTGGVFEGLRNVYLNRGWRPILFPVFTVPALIVTNGDLLTSVAITLVFIHLVLLI